MNCRIFRDPERNKLIDSDPELIETLGIYYPKYDKQYKDIDKFSSLILDIKKDEKKLNNKPKEYYYYKEAIKYFTTQLRSILSDKEKFLICVMPTHNAGTKPSGIRTIAKKLCSPPIIDGIDILERVFKIDEKKIGGSRDFQKEIESLAVNNVDKIRNTQILLLDDITTTGTSLRAGKYVLDKVDPELVAMFALGKTQSEKRSQA